VSQEQLSELAKLTTGSEMRRTKDLEIAIKNFV
jgi:hypothetical protein